MSRDKIKQLVSEVDHFEEDLVRSEKGQRVIKDAIYELEAELDHVLARCSARTQFEPHQAGGGLVGGGAMAGAHRSTERETRH